MTFPFNRVEELQQRLFRRVSAAERIDEHRESAVGSISSRDVVDGQQSAKEQTRADEQKDCRGHFTDHEQRAETCRRAQSSSVCRPPSPAPTSQAPRVPRRCKPEDHPERDRHHSAEDADTRMSNVGTTAVRQQAGWNHRRRDPENGCADPTPSAPPSTASTRLSVSS